MSVLAEGIDQKMEILRRGFGPNKGLDVIKGPDRLAGEAGGDEPSDEDEEGGGGRGKIVISHVDDELPGDVELANLGDDVDEEIEGLGGERKKRAWEMLGVVEEGEGNFGIVVETEEGLVEEVWGKRDAMELERRLHGVEWVVVVEEDLGY